MIIEEGISVVKFHPIAEVVTRREIMAVSKERRNVFLRDGLVNEWHCHNYKYNGETGNTYPCSPWFPATPAARVKGFCERSFVLHAKGVNDQ